MADERHALDGSIAKISNINPLKTPYFIRRKKILRPDFFDNLTVRVGNADSPSETAKSHVSLQHSDSVLHRTCVRYPIRISNGIRNVGEREKLRENHTDLSGWPRACGSAVRICVTKVISHGRAKAERAPWAGINNRQSRNPPSFVELRSIIDERTKMRNSPTVRSFRASLEM